MSPTKSRPRSEAAVRQTYQDGSPSPEPTEKRARKLSVAPPRLRDVSLFAQPQIFDTGRALVDVQFCVVDLETTGSTASDAITEIGAVRVRGGDVTGEFQTLVNPRVGIPPLISVLTGITNSMVAGAPGLAEALPSFLEFARGCVLVAHNARFDVGFLKRACDCLLYTSRCV